MKKYSLSKLIFMALCCDIGLFAKRIIAPVANIITDSIHIPGGIGTSFSLMFLIIAAVICRHFGAATLMSAIQSVIALSLGMVGSMGALSPIGYIIPGIVIDCMLAILDKTDLSLNEKMALTNGCAGAAAAFAANLIVFRLGGIPLMLYMAVGFTSGIICGILGGMVVKRVAPVWKLVY